MTPLSRNMGLRRDDTRTVQQCRAVSDLVSGERQGPSVGERAARRGRLSLGRRGQRGVRTHWEVELKGSPGHRELEPRAGAPCGWAHFSTTVT